MNDSENLAEHKKQIMLTVNGKKIEALIDSRMTLAEFLREDLGLSGTKVGCNRGECGSCTVILDGNPVYSCTVLAVEAMGADVRTVEGLSEEGKVNFLQQSFVDHDALQCGYCTPGMLMSITALLERNPCPTRDDIREAIDGNLCRCGSYPNIIEATIAAAKKFVDM